MFGFWRGWDDWRDDGGFSLDGGIIFLVEKVEMVFDYKSVKFVLYYIMFKFIEEKKKKGYLFFIDGELLCFFGGDYYMSSVFDFDFIFLVCRSCVFIFVFVNGRWWCRKYCWRRDWLVQFIGKIGYYVVGIVQERYFQIGIKVNNY